MVKKGVNIIYLSREFHKKNSYNETVIKNYIISIIKFYDRLLDYFFNFN